MESRLAPAEDVLDDDNAGSVHRYVDLIKGWIDRGKLFSSYNSPESTFVFNCCIFSHDADDEFVSESFQGATKKEMAEVNESMRRLGLGGGGGKLNCWKKIEFNLE